MNGQSVSILMTSHSVAVTAARFSTNTVDEDARLWAGHQNDFRHSQEVSEIGEVHNDSICLYSWTLLPTTA